MSELKIHSQRAILVEGDASELVPSYESAVGTHGFAIMVPPGEAGERFLDLVWRITILYGSKPNWLRSRAMMSKLVDAVMSKESRVPKPVRGPGREKQMPKLAQLDRPASAQPLSCPALASDVKLHGAIASSPALRHGSKVKTRRKK